MNTMIILGVLICALLILWYSMMCAPDVYMDCFGSPNVKNTPESHFFYVIGSLLLGITLLGAIIRIATLVKQHNRSKTISTN